MSYRVVVTREDDAWLADVPELEGAHTWAKNLPALDRGLREVVVLAADLPDEAMASLEFDYEYDTGDEEIDDEAAELRRRRVELEQQRRKVTARTDAAVKRLVSRGYSMRDTAALIGVSLQRVQQLAGSKKAKTAVRKKSDFDVAADATKGTSETKAKKGSARGTAKRARATAGTSRRSA